MYARLRQQVLQAATSRGVLAFVFAALIVGVLVGLAAAALLETISLIRRVLGYSADGTDYSLWWLPLATVPIGLLISWTIGRLWAPGVSGGGVTETMVGLTVRGGYLPTRSIPAKFAATAVTLGAGGSAGREGPVVQIGATIGSAFARYTRFGEDQIRSLIAAGAGAGIGAAFNAPIAGMLFAMEVLLGHFSVRHLNAVVVSSVAAAVTTRTLVGEEVILSAPAHLLEDPRELILYALLGLLATALALLFLRVLRQTGDLTLPRRAPGWLLPVGAGLLVAIAGVFWPEALGTGQSWVAGLLRLTPDSTAFWGTIFFLGVLKIFTNSTTRAGGGSGGTFMPSLYIGAAAGAALALVVGPAWPFSEINPGAFAVVGMAATFSAVARAPLTAIIIVFEITGDYGLVLPLMLAASIATFLTDRVHPETAYTVPLRRRGIHLRRSEDIDLLDTVTVADVMTRDMTALSPDQTLAEALLTLERDRHHGLPVTDGGKLVGILTVSDVEAAGGSSEEQTVGDAMTARPITVPAMMPVSSALARMAALGVGRMPVVADDDSDRVVGMFRRESVVRAYHHALGASTDRSLYRERLQARRQPGASFYELPIPARSPVAGTRVADVTWPEDLTLVSIRRGGSVLIPHGDTLLSSGDTLTAFGTSESRVELAYSLEPDPTAEITMELD